MTPAPRRARGFTLFELLIVILIVGLLMSYVAPRYFSQIGKSEREVARAQIDAFEKALEQYRLDTGKLPTTQQGLLALTEKPVDEPKWRGPYLKRMAPPDPWGKEYVYRVPGAKFDFEIISYGKDGAPGGTGDAADLSNVGP